MTPPLTMPAETGRPVITKGEGNRTTAHLNLTVTMEAQIAAEVAQHDRHSTMSGERRKAQKYPEYYPNRFLAPSNAGDRP